MKNRNIHYRTTIPALLIALVLGCFPLSPAVQANDGRNENDGHSIVGLWHVHYTSDLTGPLFESYDQWYSDGLEFEGANLPAAVGNFCQGTWKMAHRSVQLFHVGWTYDETGALTGYFEETQINTVSHDRNSYDGTYDDKFYDTDGNFVGEDTGTLHATRLSVH